MEACLGHGAVLCRVQRCAQCHHHTAGCPRGALQKFMLQKDFFPTRRKAQEEERNVSEEPIKPRFMGFTFLILIFLIF